VDSAKKKATDDFVVLSYAASTHVRNPGNISRLRKTITLDLITTAENHIMRISRDSSDIAICAARYRECGANRATATDPKQRGTKAAQLSPN
jgi:hypothetical protein